jgi:hypothetical protein
MADDCKGINQYAVPLGIVLVRDTVITICQSDSIVLEDFAKNRYRQYPVQTMEGFVISILGRAVMVYIRLLKYVCPPWPMIARESISMLFLSVSSWSAILSSPSAKVTASFLRILQRTGTANIRFRQWKVLSSAFSVVQ